MLQVGKGFKALLKGSMPAWAVQEAGAPAEVWLDIQAPEDTDSLLLDVIWVNKTATRLPEVRTSLHTSCGYVCLCDAPAVRKSAYSVRLGVCRAQQLSRLNADGEHEVLLSMCKRMV